MDKENHSTLNTCLAFGFGITFCALLAYAALRSEPITDEHKFFLLRVLASLSAAGVAAVIPGFFDLGWSLATRVTLRAGGALGVFVLVFLVNPPRLVQPVDMERVTSMIEAYTTEKYNDAERYADLILQVDPSYPKALDIKGGISYYRGDYEKAAEYFSKAWKADPKMTQYASNLAYAQIEIGAPLLAIETTKGIDDGKIDWYFLMGRAELFAGKYEDAQKHLQAVPDSYFHGAARVLEASAFAGMQAQRQENAELARKSLARAFASDREYWNRMFIEHEKEKSQTYSLPVRLLGPILISETTKRKTERQPKG